MRPAHYWRDRMRLYRKEKGAALRGEEKKYLARYYRENSRALSEARRKREGWTAKADWPKVHCPRCRYEWRSKGGHPRRCPACWKRL